MASSSVCIKKNCFEIQIRPHPPPPATRLLLWGHALQFPQRTLLFLKTDFKFNLEGVQLATQRDSGLSVLGAFKCQLALTSLVFGSFTSQIIAKEIP